MLEKFLTALTALVEAIRENTQALRESAALVAKERTQTAILDAAYPRFVTYEESDAAKVAAKKALEENVAREAVLAAKVDAAKKAREEKPAAEPPAGPTPAVPTYADLANAVQDKVKKTSRDATLEVLSKFTDKAGKPLAGKDTAGAWTGSAREAKPEDFAAIIEALK